MKTLNKQQTCETTELSHVQSVDHGNLENDIEDALLNNEFKLVYQPKIQTGTGKLVGMEALIRWQSSRHGFVSPDRFIPVAEKSLQIVRIGEWVIKQSCHDLKKMLDGGLNDLHMAVNVSSVQLLEDDLCEFTLDTLLSLGLEPKHLQFELTETALILSPETASRRVKNLHNAGIRVWLDDFGTGYASLSMLREFDISGIKIDRSFVDGISTNNNDFAICSAMIVMAERLDKGVVAEGVETELQMLILGQLGCEQLQGYFISKPLSVENIVRDWSLH